MWSLESIKQINAKHAELGKSGPVSARKVYAECGILTLGDSFKENKNEPELQSEQGQEQQRSVLQG